MAQSRRLDLQSGPTARAGVRAKVVGPASRVTPNSRAVALPGTTFVPPTIGATNVSSTGLQPSAQATGQFQYPQVYGPRPYSPAGMGVAQGVQPTYVQPGVAQAVNQPVPETGMNMFQKILIFGGIAAVVGGLAMKMMGGGGSKRAPRDLANEPSPSEPYDAGTGDTTPAGNGSAESGPPPEDPVTPAPAAASSGEKTPPPLPAGQMEAEGDAAAGPIQPPVSDRTSVQPAPASVVRNAPGLPGTILVERPGTQAAARPQADPAADAPAVVNPALPKSDRLPTTVQGGLKAPPPPAKPATKPVQETREPVRPPAPPVQVQNEVCAQNVRDIQRKGLQKLLNPLIRNRKIESGYAFSWRMKDKSFQIEVRGDTLTPVFGGITLTFKQICSDGRKTSVQFAYGSRAFNLTVVKQADETFLAQVAENGKAKDNPVAIAPAQVHRLTPTEVGSVYRDAFGQQ